MEVDKVSKGVLHELRASRSLNCLVGVMENLKSDFMILVEVRV